MNNKGMYLMYEPAEIIAKEIVMGFVTEFDIQWTEAYLVWENVAKLLFGTSFELSKVAGLNSNLRRKAQVQMYKRADEKDEIIVLSHVSLAIIDDKVELALINTGGVYDIDFDGGTECLVFTLNDKGVFVEPTWKNCFFISQAGLAGKDSAINHLGVIYPNEKLVRIG